MYKFEEALNLPLGKWLIRSDEGYSDMTKMLKTIPYDIWYVCTENFEIKVADKHIFFSHDFKQIPADELSIGDMIYTKNGLEPVKEVYFMGYQDNTYSPSVLNEKHSYYANGILNKNTTIVAVFLVHYLIFSKEKTIAVLANKMQGAIEIVDRAKVIIEGLPDFLKPGIKLYNKKRIELENGCKLLAAATTPSAVRGLSINCTDGQNLVRIKDNLTGEEETLSMEALHRRLLLESCEGFNEIIEQ